MEGKEMSKEEGVTLEERIKKKKVKEGRREGERNGGAV